MKISKWLELFRFLLIINVLVASVEIKAQQQPPRGVGSGGTNNRDASNNPNTPQDQSKDDDGPDTTVYNYILLDDPFKEHIVTDTVLNISFMQDDPINTRGNEHANTGNKGSATLPLIYQPQVNTTWQSGYNGYDIYKLKLKDFRFYSGNRPITDLYFSQFANQQNLNVGVNFSSNFKNGFSIALEYDRISQAGLYREQATKSTQFAIGLRYYEPKKRYQAFLTFVRNVNEEQHNGGLVDYDELKTNNLPTTLSLRLNKAVTRHQEQQIAFIQYLKINNPKNKVWRLYLKNDLIFNPAKYKFADNELTSKSDTSFYGQYLIDKRGIRTYLDVSHIHNGFYIKGERTKGIQGRIGLLLDLYAYKNGPLNQRRTDLSAQFDGQIPLGKALNINTKATFGIGENFGTFDASGLLNLKISKYAIMTGGVRFFNSEPNYKSETLIVNDQTVYSKQLNNYFGTTFMAWLDIPKFSISGGIKQHIVNNPIYWDKTNNPVQSNDILSTTYITAENRLKVWRIHFDNQVHVQVLSSSIYPLPRLFSTHQLYFGGRIFKNVMQIKSGLDVRWVKSHQGANFQPLVNDFGLSDVYLSEFPRISFFILSKVARFRIYVGLENIGRYFSGDNYNNYIVNYPIFDPKLRFSIRWIIKD